MTQSSAFLSKTANQNWRSSPDASSRPSPQWIPASRLDGNVQIYPEISRRRDSWTQDKERKDPTNRKSPFWSDWEAAGVSPSTHPSSTNLGTPSAVASIHRLCSFELVSGPGPVRGTGFPSRIPSRRLQGRTLACRWLSAPQAPPPRPM